MSKRDCFKALGIKSLSDEFESSVVDGMTDEEIRDLGTKIALNYYNKLDKDLVKLKKSVGLKVKESPISFEPPQKNNEEIAQQAEGKNKATEDARVSGVKETPVEKPSQEQQLADIENGNVVTFTYSDESEVPDQFKDKISSISETNGQKKVRVTVAKSLADYELSNQQKPKQNTKEQKSGDVQGDKEARTQPSDVDELTDLTEFEKSLTDEEGRSIEEEEGASKESVSDPEIGVKSPPSKPATEPAGDIRKKADKKVTAIMNGMTSAEDMDKIDPERQELKMSDKDVLEAAKKRVDSGQSNPEALVIELAGERKGQGNARVLSPEEVAELTYYKMQLINRMEVRNEEMEQIPPTSAEYQYQKRLLKADMNQFERLQRATALAGTRQAQAFRLRQLTIDEEYSLANQVLRYKTATDRDNVPPEVMREFEKLNKEYKKIKKDLAKAEEKLRKQEEENQKLRAPKAEVTTKTTDKRVDDLVKRLRKAKFVQTKKDLQNLQSDPTGLFKLAWDGSIEAVILALKGRAELSKAVQKGVESIKNSDWYKGLTKENKKKAQELTRRGLQEEFAKSRRVAFPEVKDGMLVMPDSFIIDRLINEGFDTIDKATKQAKKILQEEFDIDLPERTVRDAISSYGKTRELSQEDAKIKLRRMKRYGKLISQLEDARKKKRPLRSGANRDKLEAKERRLRREINELLKDIPLTEQEQADQWKSALDAVKSRLRNRIEDLKNQIKAKEKTKPKSGVEYDAEATALKEEADSLSIVLEELVGKPELTDEQKVLRAEKVLERSIELLEKKIQKEDFSLPTPEKISSPKIDRLTEKKKKLQEEYNSLKEKSPEHLSRKERKRIDTIEKQIDAILKKIDSGDITTKKRKAIQESPEVELLKEQRRVLNEKLAKMRKDAQPSKKMTKEEKQYNSVVRQIDKVLAQLAGNEPITTPKKKKILSDRVTEAREELAKLKEKLAQTPEAQSAEQERKVQSQLRAKEKQIENIQKKINGDIDIFAKKKASKDLDTRVKQANEEVEALRETLKETQKYKDAVEKRRLAQAKKAVERSIANYEQRLRDKEFESVKRKEIKPDEELRRLRIEKQKIFNKFELEQERAKLRERSFSEKFIDGIYDALSLPRTLMASVDLSAPFRQGLILTVGMTLSRDSKKRRAVLNSWGEMFRQAWSKDRYDSWLADIQSNEDYIFAKTMGLQLTLPTASIDAREEMFMNRLAGNLFNVKVGDKKYGYGSLVDASSRAYSAYLNVLRMGAFADYSDRLREAGYDPTTKEGQEAYKLAASFINNATGRGDLGAFEKGGVGRFLSILFFAPKYVVSRFNILASPIKYFNAPKEVRREVTKTLLKFIGTGMSTLTMAAMAGADVEDDPRSSDFGKIRIGNLRFDIWGGMQQPVRLLIQTIVGESKDVNTGEIKSMNDGTFLGKTRLGLWGKFLRFKLSPTSGLVVDLLNSNYLNYKTRNPKVLGFEMPWEEAAYITNAVNQDETNMERFSSMIFPLFIQDMVDIANEEGFGISFGAFVPALFGVGASYYVPENKSTTSGYNGVETILDDVSLPEIEIPEIE